MENSKPYSYNDTFVKNLIDDIGSLILGDSSLRVSVHEKLLELATANSPQLNQYWNKTSWGFGIPDQAFKEKSPYLFPMDTVVKTFRTSGTTGQTRGSASYSQHGLDLMKQSICRSAARHLIKDLQSPVIVRLVPPEEVAPEMVMAFGMELIAKTFGHPDLSTSVVSSNGFDLQLLQKVLDAAVLDNLPVILLGGSSAFVNLCVLLKQQNLRWQLPAGSQVMDAGGFKSRAGEIKVEDMRTMVSETFGVPIQAFKNIFGMTELASQLYDAVNSAVGPLGECPKGNETFVECYVRSPLTMKRGESTIGMLEVVDLCIIDRPCTVLTGDLGIATAEGVAIVGRVARGQSRGCSLALDEVTTQQGAINE